MLRITKCKSVGAAADYYRDIIRRAQYYGSAELPSAWEGVLATKLGLTGQVTEHDLMALLRNRTPNGDRLTHRDDANRVCAIDFTANAPKSVSILWAMTGDERIVKAHRDAVQWMMREVERDVKTRVRVDGRNEDRKTGNALWLPCLEFLSRPVSGIEDPHLHTHALLINVTEDAAEGKRKAVQIGDIKGEGEYYQSVYLAVLAKRMAELGYGIERNGKWWEIAGINRDLIESFSNRTQQIEAAAVAAGIISPETKATLGQRTREHKTGATPIDDLRGIWQARIGPRARYMIDCVLGGAKRGLNKVAEINLRQLGRIVLSDVLGSETATAEKKVLQKILQRGYGAVLPSEARATLEAQGILRGTVGGRDWITTREALTMERAIIAYARDGRNRCAPLGSDRYRIQSEWLNTQQRSAIAHIWSSQDQILLVRGGAGVGKTTLMSEAVAGVAAAGHQNFVFASTVPATEVLRQEGFETAQTVQRLIASEQVQSHVGKHAVIWVDEAGLMDVGTMHQLFELAQRWQWRVILMGDEKQHKPVDRGDAMRILRDRAHLPVAEVREIVRQRGAYKQAVATIEQGDVQTGWKQLEAMGAVIEAQGAQRVQLLSSDYLAARERGESVLVVAPTNRERMEVTDAIRWLLKHEGKIGADDHSRPFMRNLYWREEARMDVENYKPGQIVRFFKHAPGGIRAGESYVIEGRQADDRVVMRSSDGSETVLPLEHADRFHVFFALEERAFAVGDRIRMVETGTTTGGKKLTKGSFHTVTGFTEAGELILTHDRILPKDFAFADHGYVTTSVSSQGLTVDTVLLAMGADSIPAMSKEQFYVSTSRGRRNVRLYVDDVQEVREAIAHSSARPSAHELMDGMIHRKDTRDERLRAWRMRVLRAAEQQAQEKAALVDAVLQQDVAQTHIGDMSYQGKMKDYAAELGD